MKLMRWWLAAVVIGASGLGCGKNSGVGTTAQPAKLSGVAKAAATQPAQVDTETLKSESARPATDAAASIAFTEETLPNGLRVIYAPLHQAPVVHVRVLYHVGSRDERPDRQGFAHMFEHMMFRGSAHVPPQEHMKLIGMVGGYSNAFTSFDQTVYVNTIPSNYLEMALYLEADRMASFKVTEEIYKIERNVVAEEWRMKQNRPYGNMYEDFLKTAFTKHSYRWTPIGNMEHLKNAHVEELQDFFNTYYIPNNSVLVIAGDFKDEQAREQVHKYFGWIPKGAPVPRAIPAEPKQTEAKQSVVPQTVPLPALLIGWKVPGFKSDDHYPLALLQTILGGGRSSRLDAKLVNSEHPLCTDVGASDWQLEDASFFGVNATVMQGQKVEEVEKALKQAVADVREKGVTDEELTKAKTQMRIRKVRGRETATDLAEQLGSEALFGDDPNRVNTELPKLEAVTSADIQRVAKEYLEPQFSTTLIIQPDPLGKAQREAATQATAVEQAAVQPATRPIEARVITFPQDYPQQAPIAQAQTNPKFEKGVEQPVSGVKVIVMADHRLPLVGWNFTMRRGSHAEPAGTVGLGWLTAEMVRRGPQGTTFTQFNQGLEEKGITIEVSDGGDYTRLSGSCTSDQLDEAIEQSRKLLASPLFDAQQFEALQSQLIDVLRGQQASAGNVASNDLSHAIFGDSPVGRYATPQSLSGITLQDVRDYFVRTYRSNDAILLLSGDVSVEKGQALAAKLLSATSAMEALPQVKYELPPTPAKRRIILVDRPEGKQSTVRMGIVAYDIHSDEKFAGSVGNQILTAGIDSRLGRYVRAQKGLAYSVNGYFSPGRHAGAFYGQTDTKIESTADAVEAMFKVFDDMRKENVTDKEMIEAKLRVSGGMVMGMQTIAQQAQYRIDAILNGYPVDYYDVYPQRIEKVVPGQVRDVMQKYVNDDAMTIVVVAPAAAVQEQLKRLGEVEVLPMPSKRGGTTTQPVTAPELLKPAK